MKVLYHKTFTTSSVYYSNIFHFSQIYSINTISTNLHNIASFSLAIPERYRKHQFYNLNSIKHRLTLYDSLSQLPVHIQLLCQQTRLIDIIVFSTIIAQILN